MVYLHTKISKLISSSKNTGIPLEWLSSIKRTTNQFSLLRCNWSFGNCRESKRLLKLFKIKISKKFRKLKKKKKKKKTCEINIKWKEFCKILLVVTNSLSKLLWNAWKTESRAGSLFSVELCVLGLFSKWCELKFESWKEQWATCLRSCPCWIVWEYLTHSCWFYVWNAQSFCSYP